MAADPDALPRARPSFPQALQAELSELRAEIQALRETRPCAPQ